MSTDSNKALIHRWIDAWNRADLDVIDELFAATYSVNDALVGPPGVKQAVQYLHAAFSPVTLTLDDLIAEGDKVVARWTARGIHTGTFMGLAPTGKPVQLTGINIYRIHNHRIVANHEQVSTWELRQQYVLHSINGLPHFLKRTE